MDTASFVRVCMFCVCVCGGVHVLARNKNRERWRRYLTKSEKQHKADMHTDTNLNAQKECQEVPDAEATTSISLHVLRIVDGCAGLWLCGSEYKVSTAAQCISTPGVPTTAQCISKHY